MFYTAWFCNCDLLLRPPCSHFTSNYSIYLTTSVMQYYGSTELALTRYLSVWCHDVKGDDKPFNRQNNRRDIELGAKRSACRGMLIAARTRPN